jgi:hypothetical protein
MPLDDCLILGRKATSAVIDMVCQTSPAQAAFRAESRRYDKLTQRLFALRAAGEDTESTSMSW